MWVICVKNQISEDVFDFMISYLPFPRKSIRSELAKLFTISILLMRTHSIDTLNACKIPKLFETDSFIFFKALSFKHLFIFLTILSHNPKHCTEQNAR